jgi:hypothetical protein
VDDCARYLLPLRQAVPHLGWVTLAMHPIGDELFMDWPLMVQMDAVIWPYAPLVGLPTELAAVADKVVQTGPFLETDGVPDQAAALIQLGLPVNDPLLVYAPRGFPFGREFGHRVLAGVIGAAAALREAVHPRLRLVLLAVGDLAELRGIPGVPDPLPDWVDVKGIVTPAESLLHTRAASAVVGEGTSTTGRELSPSTWRRATQRARRNGISQQLLAAGKQAEPAAAAERHGDAQRLPRNGPVQAVVYHPGAHHAEQLRPDVANGADNGERHEDR